MVVVSFLSVLYICFCCWVVVFASCAVIVSLCSLLVCCGVLRVVMLFWGVFWMVLSLFVAVLYLRCYEVVAWSGLHALSFAGPSSSEWSLCAGDGWSCVLM